MILSTEVLNNVPESTFLNSSDRSTIDSRRELRRNTADPTIVAAIPIVTPPIISARFIVVIPSRSFTGSVADTVGVSVDTVDVSADTVGVSADTVGVSVAGADGLS